MYGNSSPSLCIAVDLWFRHDIRQISNIYEVVRYNVDDSYGFDLKMAEGQWEEIEFRMSAGVWAEWSVKGQSCTIGKTTCDLPDHNVSAQTYYLCYSGPRISLHSI